MMHETAEYQEGTYSQEKYLQQTKSGDAVHVGEHKGQQVSVGDTQESHEDFQKPYV